MEIAGEGGAPALLEDQPMERFHGAVGLRPPGADQRVTHAELVECLTEGA
jgi:hypothetical protein